MGNKSSTGFSYKLGEQQGESNEEGWTRFDGVSSVDGQHITVFRFKQTEEKWKTECAANTLKHTKTLRHPYTLKFLEGGEVGTETVIATEQVTPLLEFMATLRKEESQEAVEMAVSWGLYCIAKAISFVNKDCSMVHGNLCPGSIFVTRGGDWKLGGFSLTGKGVERLKDFPALLPNRYKPPERMKNDWQAMQGAPPTAIDAWGLGCVLFEALNGPVTNADQLLDLNRVPLKFQALYKSLLSADPCRRLDPTDIITSPLITTTSFAKSLLFVEEFHIKSPEEKRAFFAKLAAELPKYPAPFWFKFLESISSVFTIQPTTAPNGQPQTGVGALHSSVLGPLLLIGTKLEEEEYERLITPRVLDLFASNDRGTRVALLQNINSFIGRISDKLVNDKIFSCLCTGFSDTTPLLRELTIKAMVSVAPKLNNTNLQDKLMRHFAALQSDAEPAIRTNTVICLGMIFDSLTKETQVKVITGGFTKALRDPFEHTRLATMKVFNSRTDELKEVPEVVVSKVLPTICMTLGDPSPEVRALAFKFMTHSLPWLQKVSEEKAKVQIEEAKKKAEEDRLKKLNEPERVGELNKAPASSQGSGTYLKSAAGWAVGSIASRWTGSDSSTSRASAPVASSSTTTTTTTAKDDDWDDEGFNSADDGGATEKVVSTADKRKQDVERRREERRKRREDRKAAKGTTSDAFGTGGGMQLKSKAPAKAATSGGGWGDDDGLDLLDMGVDLPATAAPPMTATKDFTSDDFFAEMAKPAKTQAPASGSTARRASKPFATKVQVKDDDDDWDNW